MSENTAGSGSGLKHAKPFNFGFMAGVRQLRDEEYQDQYKPSLKPPGSYNFLRVAQEQFNMEAEGEGHSGYMAEEPGNTPAWRRVPEHLKKLRLPGLLYDGTAQDDPNDSYEGGIVGQWSAKMRKHGQVGKAPLPGYDGAVSGFYGPGGGEEDAPEGEHEVATVEASAEMTKAIAKAERNAKVQALLEKRSAKSASTVSGPKFLSEARTYASDPNSSLSGWEVGSENSKRLGTLKQLLFKMKPKTKAMRGGAE